MCRMRAILAISLLLPALLLLSCEQKTETLATFTVVAADSGSVFDQSRQTYNLQYDSSEAGIFVKSIEGVSQSKQAFWLYTVNGQPGNLACEQFPVAPGDTIVWKLTSLY